MSHTTETVNIAKQGAFIVLTVECCGKKKSNHSIAALAFANFEDRKSAVEEAHKIAAEKHDIEQRAEQAMPDELGVSIEHA
jgi:hypothetical protein